MESCGLSKILNVSIFFLKDCKADIIGQTYQAYHARVVEKKKWNSLLVQLHKLSNGQYHLRTLTLMNPTDKTPSLLRTNPDPKLPRRSTTTYLPHNLKSPHVPVQSLRTAHNRHRSPHIRHNQLANIILSRRLALSNPHHNDRRDPPSCC
jgi:hypothetical protein